MPTGVYKRTIENTKNVGGWNRGLTKETSESVARRGKKMKGKHWKWSEQYKKKRSETQTKLWQNPIYREHMSKIHTGHIVSEDTKKKLSKANVGKQYSKELYPNFGKRNKLHSEITKKKISISIKKIWQDPKFQKTIAKALNLKPNNLEKFFDKLTPKSIKYTGNRRFWITTKRGARNPDFKVKGQNKIIEVFGDYWHKREDPNITIKEYAEVGWECIVFWENQIYSKTKKVLGEILKFIEIKV